MEEIEFSAKPYESNEFHATKQSLFKI